MQSLVEGISMGLVLSALVGPVFFTLITNSMEHGFRYAAVLAFGIFCSDAIYVLLTYFGISLLTQTDTFQLLLGYFGGGILVGFGINSLIKKSISRPNTGGILVGVSSKKSAFAKGFSINGVNPFVLLFWLSIAGLVTQKQNWEKEDVLFYYLGILLTVFSIDLVKAFIAKQVSGLMTPRLMWILNKLVGLIMIFFGMKMIWSTYSV
ncbi:MAG: lysine transporter LysE [Algoriphagus sp. 32-45-6]|nr:MAG: lysine transporter LysE [Algoriphagus sp. 32-45-6]